MVERGKARAEKKGIVDESKATELTRSADDAPIKVSLKSTQFKKPESVMAANPFKQIKATKPGMNTVFETIYQQS